eukprot:gene12609-biopygen2626
MSDVGPVERRRSCEARQVLWSAAENVDYADCVQCHGVRGVPRSAAECRGVPRSAAECAERLGMPRSLREGHDVLRSAQT